MGKITVVSSSSKGNGYILDDGNSQLIIELGCRFEDYLKVLDYKIENVVGAIVSHRHSDHAKYIPNALKRQISVYSCQDVAEQYPGVKVLYTGNKYRISDSYFVQPISVQHSVENYAYIVDCDEFGRMLFITDCVRFPYRIKGVNHLIVEANYSNDTVLDHMMNGYEIRSQNQYHMELEDTIECIKNNISSELNNVVIAHLSDGQSDERMFADRIYDDTGIMPKIASKGLKIELNKEEF